MKKCASCSKDLPDAALHCVFCGAKQPPAPATTAGLAKTVMGSYSANDVMDHLRGQQPGGGAPPRAAPGPTPGPSYGAPPPAPQPSPYQRPAPASAPPPMAGPPAGGPPGAGAPYGVPAAPHEAKTLFVSPAAGGPAPPQGGQGGQGGPGGQGGQLGNIPGARPMPQQPFSPQAGAHNAAYYAGPGPGPAQAAMPAPRPMPQPQTPPYLSSQAAARSGRPIEPWKDSLRLMMFLWGGALLVVFAAPLGLEPLSFNWDTIINSEGKAKLPPLILAAVGLLSIVLALIPTSPAPRGLIAGVLGLVGVAHAPVLGEVTAWKTLAPLGGMLLLIPGLLIREEYRESILPRIMVTLGVIAILLPILLPEGGKLPLVELFKEAIDQPGKAKVLPLLQIAYIVLVVLTLLAWLPGPASGGAKVFAWLLLLWPGIVHITTLVLADAIVDTATKRPNEVIAWAAETSYLVLIGYGFATVIGKKLE